MQIGLQGNCFMDNKPTGEMKKRGPIKYSMPTRPTKTEPLIDTKKIRPKRYKPNRVKLGIKEGESRFPAESIVENSKKYNEKGEYIKHKDEYEKRNPAPMPGALKIAKGLALSNPHKK